MKKLRCKLPILMASQEPPMTQTALIEALKVGPHTISRLYNNTFKRVDADTVEKLCEYFDCDLTDLFELKGERGNGKRFAD